MFTLTPKKLLCFILGIFSFCSGSIAKESGGHVNRVFKFDEKEIHFNEIHDGLCGEQKIASDLNMKNQRVIRMILDNEYLYKEYIRDYGDEGVGDSFDAIKILTFSQNKEKYLLIFFQAQLRDGRGVLYNLTAGNKIIVRYDDLLEPDYVCITHFSREPELKIKYRLDQCEYEKENKENEEKYIKMEDSFVGVFSESIRKSKQKRKMICVQGDELSAEINIDRWASIKENITKKSPYVYFGRKEN